MALMFNSSSYLSSPVAVVSSAPCTLACWFNVATRHTGVLMSVTDGANNNNAIHLHTRSEGRLRGNVHGTGSATATTATDYTAGQWHHALFVCRSDTDRSIYLDGGGRVDSFGFATSGSLNNTAIGRLVRPASPFNVIDGRIAEAAFWSEALTDNEVRELALGRSPLGLTRRLKGLRFYHDLMRTPGLNRVGPPLGVFGEPIAVAHPRVWFPGGHRPLGVSTRSRFYSARSSQAFVSGADSGSVFVAGAELANHQPAAEVYN